MRWSEAVTVENEKGKNKNGRISLHIFQSFFRLFFVLFCDYRRSLLAFRFASDFVHPWLPSINRRDLSSEVWGSCRREGAGAGWAYCTTVATRRVRAVESHDGTNVWLGGGGQIVENAARLQHLHPLVWVLHYPPCHIHARLVS